MLNTNRIEDLIFTYRHTNNGNFCISDTKIIDFKYCFLSSLTEILDWKFTYKYCVLLDINKEPIMRFTNSN